MYLQSGQKTSNGGLVSFPPSTLPCCNYIIAIIRKHLTKKIPTH